MKIKFILLGLFSSFLLAPAAAQRVEHDDMYFNAGDRAALREAREAEQTTVTSRAGGRGPESREDVNPTDSYSARNVNPEYISRSTSQSAREDEEDYYDAGNYQNTRTGFNRWNNNFNSWYGSAWYRPNYWTPSIYGWNSPYYGSAYDSWGHPWANPCYQSGWGTSFSFHYGSSWNYGWAGYNPYWDSYYNGWDPYYGYASYWNPYRSYYGWGGYGYYPARVVVTGDDRYGATYGKRSSRSSQLSRDSDGSTRSSGRLADSRGRERSDGRVSNSASRQRNDYYDHSNTRPAPARTYNNDGGTNTRSSWESQHRSNSTYSSPSRSSTFDSGTRSNSGSNSSGSSGSRSSRGRGGN